MEEWSQGLDPFSQVKSHPQNCCRIPKTRSIVLTFRNDATHTLNGLGLERKALDNIGLNEVSLQYSRGRTPFISLGTSCNSIGHYVSRVSFRVGVGTLYSRTHNTFTLKVLLVNHILLMAFCRLDCLMLCLTPLDWIWRESCRCCIAGAPRLGRCYLVLSV